MTQHRHYETARRAHYNTSFTPEKRATDACAALDASLAELRGLGVPQERIDKYEALWLDWMHKKSRCLSSMITGPAKFPVRRAEKANAAEHKASDACSQYYAKLVTYAKREAYYAEHPEARPVASNDADALDRLREKLAAAQSEHDAMKAANKEKRGTHQSFTLTNSNARIKQIKDRIAEIERRKEQGEQVTTIGGVRVVQNPDDMRLQLFFDGKPSEEMRALLKSHAFKWAPSVGAWQRQLTSNALFTFKHYVKPALEEV